MPQNLWGESAASSGSQCTGVDSLSGSSLKWHTKWSWAGGSSNVKSYANVVTKVTQKALSGITSLPSTWSYSYTGSSIVANVAYDLFTSSTASGSAEYEVRGEELRAPGSPCILDGGKGANVCVCVV